MARTKAALQLYNCLSKRTLHKAKLKLCTIFLLLHNPLFVSKIRTCLIIFTVYFQSIGTFSFFIRLFTAELIGLITFSLASTFMGILVLLSQNFSEPHLFSLNIFYNASNFAHPFSNKRSKKTNEKKTVYST